MSDMIRDSTLGYAIRTITRGKVFAFPEQAADFSLPDTYHLASEEAPSAARELPPAEILKKTPTKDIEASGNQDLEKTPTVDADASEIEQMPTVAASETSTDYDGSDKGSAPIAKTNTIDRHLDLGKVTSRADLERALTAATMEKMPTRPIIPTKTKEGIILVDWYTTDDQANPQNWSTLKKASVTAMIFFYTMAVYMGSSLYTSSEPYIIEIFDIQQDVASLGLALYVLGYGTGPLLFSPMSEIPIVGRNPPYLITFGIFILLTVGASVVDNVPGLLVLRFLQGFFGSPCLATSGATLGDMYNILQLPYMLTIWVSGAVAGPSLGPLISGFSVPAENWHWSMWELLWLASPVFIIMLIAMPETSASNILLRRAQRLRAATDHSNLQSQSEIDQANLTASKIVVESLLRPFEITLLDPSILFATIYTAIMYAIYYSFFESFPIVFLQMRHFNLGETGLAFLAIPIGVILSIFFYFSFLYFRVNPRIVARGLGEPEERLIPGLIASFLVPAGLFIFAWTANPAIHWIVPLIGISIQNAGIFIVFQAIFMYIPLSYPQYAASLFAANDFARSSLSFAAILFSTPMFRTLDVDRGVTLLAGLTVAGIPGMWALWYFGKTLRSKSKYTLKG